jgi:hypothetical protein
MALMPSLALERPAWAALTAVAVSGSLIKESKSWFNRRERAQIEVDARRVDLPDGACGRSKRRNNLQAVNVALDASQATGSGSTLAEGR